MIAPFNEVRAVKVLGRWVAVGLVCGVGLLTGCSSGEPEAADPTPAVVEPSEAPESAEPSPEPTAEESEEQHVAAAKQLVQEYFEALWALGNDGYRDIGSMSRFWGDPDVAARELATIEAERATGYTSEGNGAIVSQTATEYDRSSGFARVRIDVCVDYSGFRNFDASGVQLENAVTRMLTKLLVVEQPDDSWTINEVASDPSWVC